MTIGQLSLRSTHEIRREDRMIQRVMIGMGAVLTGLVVAAVTATGNEEPESTTERDIVYTKAGSTELKLDLVRPKDRDGLFPAILVIHGGAWRQGNKADVRPMLTEFIRHGYVAVVPQYRFCPQDAFPAQVHDVKGGVGSNRTPRRIELTPIGLVRWDSPRAATWR